LGGGVVSLRPEVKGEVWPERKGWRKRRYEEHQRIVRGEARRT